MLTLILLMAVALNVNAQSSCNALLERATANCEKRVDILLNLSYLTNQQTALHLHYLGTILDGLKKHVTTPTGKALYRDFQRGYESFLRSYRELYPALRKFGMDTNELDKVLIIGSDAL